MMINLQDKESFFTLVDQVFEKDAAFKKFFSSTSTLNVILNTKGEALFLSSSWGKILGYSEEELKSVPLNTFSVNGKNKKFICKSGDIIEVKWISYVDSEDGKYELGTAIILG